MTKVFSAIVLAAVVSVPLACSDDDGTNVLPKDQSGGAAGPGGAGGMSSGGSAGRGGSDLGDGGSTVGQGGGAGCPNTPAEPPDAGDAGPADGGLSDAGALDAGALDASALDAGDASAAPALVSFAADIHPIFAQRCGPCHVTDTSGGHNVGSADIDAAYADAVRLGQELVSRVNGGGMPPSYADPPNDCEGPPGTPGCVTAEELALIQTWIAQCNPR